MLENCTMLFRLALSIKVMSALQYILYSFKFLAKKISGNGSLIHLKTTHESSFLLCMSERKIQGSGDQCHGTCALATISFARSKMAAAVQVVTDLAGNKQIVHRS